MLWVLAFVWLSWRDTRLTGGVKTSYSTLKISAIRAPGVALYKVAGIVCMPILAASRTSSGYILRAIGLKIVW